jgi:hypothetical protein
MASPDAELHRALGQVWQKPIAMSASKDIKHD